MNLREIEFGLRDFLNFPTVVGVCLQKGHEPVVSLFPKTIGTNRVTSLCENLYSFWEGYMNSARQLEYICFEFDGILLVIIGYKDALLSFSCHNDEAVEMLTSAGKTYLRDNIDMIALPSPSAVSEMPPDPETWQNCVAGITACLHRLLSAPQAKNLIARVVENMGYTMEEGVPYSRFRELVLEIALEIPNRSKQEALKNDLISLIESL
ncbi:MAG: hypothetical protein AAF558_02475 [Verrucomicrobiota bacterium]